MQDFHFTGEVESLRSLLAASGASVQSKGPELVLQERCIIRGLDPPLNYERRPIHHQCPYLSLRTHSRSLSLISTTLPSSSV